MEGDHKILWSLIIDLASVGEASEMPKDSIGGFE